MKTPSVDRHPISAPRRAPAGRLGLATLVLAVAGSAWAQSTPPKGMVDLGKYDPRLKNHFALKGIKVQIIASEPMIIDPTAMAIADDGSVYVAEWKKPPSLRMYDEEETIRLPEGGTQKVLHRRKAQLDLIKRLWNPDSHGVFRNATVVIDNVRMPASIFLHDGAIDITPDGKLVRCRDTAGTGLYADREVLAYGFAAFYHHWLSGMTLGPDGWLYLTAGDNDNHVVGKDGSRVEVSRCGAIFRCRPDGTQMHLFAMGFRNPYRDVAFDSRGNLFHLDNDNEDGSKWQGCRLYNPVEGGDYGWRLRVGAPCCAADFDRGAVSGELLGKLPIITKTGRGSPAGGVVYTNTQFPARFRDMFIYPDVFRKLVRGYKFKHKGASFEVAEEVPLMTAADDLFRPCQAAVGPDGAIYILDWRTNSGGAGRLWGDATWGRLYRLSWDGDDRDPAIPLKPNNFNRILQANDSALVQFLRSADEHDADRAQVEAVHRGARFRRAFLALMNDRTAPVHARLLGLGGAGQFWNDAVQAACLEALDDPIPEVRRLAAQALSWEARPRSAVIAGAMAAHLDREQDPQVIRDLVLALGRHGDATAGERICRRLIEHGYWDDVVLRDAFIRALERLGPDGLRPVERRIVSARGHDQEAAVLALVAMRSADAARTLGRVATTADVPESLRLPLFLMYKDVPLNIPVNPQPIADWTVAHPQSSALLKKAVLNTCRISLMVNQLQLNPLILALVDDPDEGVRLAAIRLAGELRAPRAMPVLIRRLADPKCSATERQAVVVALRNAGSAAAAGVEAAFRKVEDPIFRREALRTLNILDRPRLVRLAETLLSSPVDVVRAEAIQLLSDQADGALVLGRAYLAGQIPPAHYSQVVAAVRKYDTPAHRAMAAQLLAAVRLEGVKAIDMAHLEEVVKTSGDPRRGLRLYLEETGPRCYQCHRLEGFGAPVGPDLSGVWQALSLPKIAQSILEPSKEIKEGYQSYKLATQDGRVLTGLLVAKDNQQIVLKTATGQEEHVPLSQVDEFAKDTVSLMPEGLVNGLSYQQFVDLLAFLKDKPTQERLRHVIPLQKFQAIGPLPGKVDGTQAVEQGLIGDTPPRTGPHGRSLAWKTIIAGPTGLADLARLAERPGIVYLTARVKSAGDQEATLLVGCNGPARLWVNGRPTGTFQPDGPAKPAQHAVTVHLHAGSNRILAKLECPEKPAGGFGAYVTLAAPQAAEPQ